MNPRAAFARLRRVAHHDGLLLAGLAVAGLTMFDRTLGVALEAANEVEKIYGVRLVPALVVLTGILILHLYAKRQEMKAAAAAGAMQARLAEARNRELEELSRLGQVLASALTVDALRVAVFTSVPGLVEQRPFCLATRGRGGWDPLMDTTAGAPPIGHEPPIVLERVLDGLDLSVPFVRQDDCCVFPLEAGQAVVGVLVVAEHESRLAAGQERVLTAVAALLAIAIRNVHLVTTLQETALTDALTGCFNRAHMLDVLDAELRRSRRTGAQLAVILIDLDGFKEVNDTRGHLAGDATLAAVGQTLRSALRRSDVRCRVGGDEFAVVLPDTYPAGAEHVAEILRRDIANATCADGQRSGVTASVGVASAGPGDDPESLLRRADHAQYEAKRAGGNRVVVGARLAA